MTAALDLLTLNSLISSVIEEFPTSDPKEVAEKVAEQTPDTDMLHFYTEALVPVVRIALCNRRNSAVRVSQEEGPARSGRTVSKKVERIRDAWQQARDSLIAVNGEGYKRFGSCTAADLKLVIETRRKHAETVLNQADYYERTVSALQDQGVETVDELNGPIQ